jgi:hypothetical protein
MLPMTREWVAKAESNYDGACEALRSLARVRNGELHGIASAPEK